MKKLILYTAIFSLSSMLMALSSGIYIGAGLVKDNSSVSLTIPNDSTYKFGDIKGYKPNINLGYYFAISDSLGLSAHANYTPFNAIENVGKIKSEGIKKMLNFTHGYSVSAQIRPTLMLGDSVGLYGIVGYGTSEYGAKLDNSIKFDKHKPFYTLGYGIDCFISTRISVFFEHQNDYSGSLNIVINEAGIKTNNDTKFSSNNTLIGVRYHF